MRTLVASALALAVVVVPAEVSMFAQCGCQPPVISAPFSGPYQIQTVNVVPLTGLQAALNEGIGKWNTMLTNHGVDGSMYPGGSGGTA